MLDKDAPVKGMPSDEMVIEKLERHLNETLTISQNWRQNEVKENFALFEGNQWTLEGTQRQAANGMPMITINRVAPVTEAICGYEMDNRLEIDLQPILANPEQEGFVDVAKNAIRYYDQKTLAKLQYSLAFKDMGICGVGAVSTDVGYNYNYDGEMEKRRVFPGFLFWDPSARAKNLTDSNYITEIKAMDRSVLKEKYGIDEFDNVYTAALDARIIEFFDSVLAIKSLGIVYDHQWRQSEPFFRVENPFRKLNIMDIPLSDLEALKGLKAQLGIQYNFNPDLDAVFSVETDSELSEIKQIFEIADLNFKSTTQHKFRYYRATLAGGKVIEKSESFHQQGFTIEFMTGQFSELTQSFYGWMRAQKDPQRMLNQTVSDYIGFLQTIPKGGVDVEIDAVKNIDQFIASYTKARFVTVYNPGGMQKSRPKIAPPVPQGILEMIQYADQQIMQVCGVPPELMGMMQTKEQNSAFLKQQIKQGYTPLAIYFDAKYMFLQRQALLDISAVRLLAENNEGRLIKNVLGEGDQDKIPLLKSNIAAEYDVYVEETPDSPGEKLETFERLIALQQQMAALPNPVNIMPLTLQYSELDPQVIKQLMQMMMPPSPPPPDPMGQALMQSEIQHKQASAQKTKADAMSTMVDAMKKHQELQSAPIKDKIDNDLTAAKTMRELSGIRSNNSNIIKDHLDHHLNAMMHESNMNLQHRKLQMQGDQFQQGQENQPQPQNNQPISQ